MDLAVKIRCNDEVIVQSGREKGKRGKVKSVLSSGKIIIEGVNLFKKHQKQVQGSNVSSGIFEKESPIHISNISIFNIDTGKPDRVGFRYENNKKVRFYKSNGEIIK